MGGEGGGQGLDTASRTSQHQAYGSAGKQLGTMPTYRMHVYSWGHYLFQRSSVRDYTHPQNACTVGDTTCFRDCQLGTIPTYRMHVQLGTLPVLEIIS